MPTSGPMLISKLHIVQPHIECQCSCGRSSRLFYRLWLGVGGVGTREEDEFLCSYCFGERAQLAPYVVNVPSSPILPQQFGHKLVLLPDPRARLTDDERADVQETAEVFSLREWALWRGEGALPYRVREGLEWEKLAEFQWAKHQTEIRFARIFPDSVEHIERRDMRLVDVKQRLTPTATEVDVLERAREAWCAFEPHLSANLDLVWVRPQGEKPRTELRVVVDIPNGSTRQLFYSLP